MCYAHWETCSSSILPPLPSFAKSIRITKTIPHTAAFASIIVDKRQKTRSYIVVRTLINAQETNVRMGTGSILQFSVSRKIFLQKGLWPTLYLCLFFYVCSLGANCRNLSGYAVKKNCWKRQWGISAKYLHSSPLWSPPLTCSAQSTRTATLVTRTHIAQQRVFEPQATHQKSLHVAKFPAPQ